MPDRIDISGFTEFQTPFYFYDLTRLRETLDAITTGAGKYGFHLHYALKANANGEILAMIKEYGLGADCVSGNEVKRALEAGFPGSRIVFAGVGKADHEIITALENTIFCLNVESVPEMEVINALAAERGIRARIALRVNPNIKANTHHYITTGLEENKFGINMWEMEDVLDALGRLTALEFTGLHFHIGSQITDHNVFRGLCLRVNEICRWFDNHHLRIKHLNLGGGLGIDYEDPDGQPIPNFDAYFRIFHELLERRPGMDVHFEPGRSIVAQCGTLISRVLYVKKGINTNFAILDAGMTELLRPALYQVYHKIENLSRSGGKPARYDVVGPICESSDCFGKAVMLPETYRGDFIAIRSVGAYGETMASQYNLRDKVRSFYSF